MPNSLPWGVIFPAIEGLSRHPTQLEEAAFHLTAAVLCALHTGSSLRGQQIKLYILAYLGFRRATEFIRPEV